MVFNFYFISLLFSFNYLLNTFLVSPPTPPVNRENIFKFSNSPSSSISPLQSHSESVLDESDEVLEETSTSPIKNLVGSSSRPKKNTRKISAHPFKILDAPNLQDDYYLNLIDWSCKFSFIYR